MLADILVNTYIDVPTDETLCVLCDSQHAYMSYFERRRQAAIESEKAKQILEDPLEQNTDVDDAKLTPIGPPSLHETLCEGGWHGDA